MRMYRLLVAPENWMEQQPTMSDPLDDLLKQLRSMDEFQILRVGTISSVAIAYWDVRVTDEVIITGERRRHYLTRHPEILNDESTLLRALVDPPEIHTNALDQRIAIIYQEINEQYALRIPVWISDREDRQNSVLSVRRAKLLEIERGRLQGRMVWRK